MKTIEIKTNLSGEELQVLMWELEAFCEGKRLSKPVLRQADVSGSLLKSLHQDLKGFQEMGFLTPDAKSGLGIAIEQVERYMRGDLEAHQQ